MFKGLIKTGTIKVNAVCIFALYGYMAYVLDPTGT